MQESYTASGKPINGPPPVHSPAVWVDDDHLSRHFAPEPFFSSKRFVSMRSRVLLAGSLLALLSAPELLAQETGHRDQEFRISNFASGPVCRDPDLVDEDAGTSQGSAPSRIVGRPAVNRPTMAWSTNAAAKLGSEAPMGGARPAMPSAGRPAMPR